MPIGRPAYALNPKLFGKGRVREVEPCAPPVRNSISDDVKLFATTFVAGFIFVSILIG